MSFFGKIFEKSFKPSLVYVELSQNHILVKDIRKQKELMRKSSLSFSNERLIIANFQVAFMLLQELISDLLDEKGKKIRKSLKIVAFVSDPHYQPICEVEKRIYRDLFEVAGANYVAFHDFLKKPSEAEIIQLFGQ